MVLFTLFFSLLCYTAAVLTSLFPKWSKKALKGDEYYILSENKKDCVFLVCEKGVKKLILVM